MHHNQPNINFQHFYLFNLNSNQNLIWKGMWIAINFGNIGTRLFLDKEG